MNQMGGKENGSSDSICRAQKCKEIFLCAESRRTHRNSECSANGPILEEQPDNEMVCGGEEIRLALHAINQRKVDNAALLVSAYVRDIAGFTKGEADNEVGNGWGAYDLGLHDAYLILAAKDAGYDTLIMGLRDADKIRSLLSIPEEEEILSVIAIGKRAEEPAQRPRKPLEEIVTFF